MKDLSLALCDQVARAYRSGKSLSISGSGSKRFLYPKMAGDQLDMSVLSGLISYEPTELVVRVNAGTPILELQAALAENQQMLAFEPPCVGGMGTVGGMVATALAGPRRPFSGAMRDFVLGVGLISGKGDLLNFGGQVMKNVAGYDISRLLVGSMGELGAITEVSLKVLPAPEQELTYAASMSVSELMAIVRSVQGSMTPISGVSHDGRVAYIRMEGRLASIERFVAGRSWHIDESRQGEFQRYWRKLCNMALPVFEQGLGSLYCIVLPQYSELDSTLDDVLMDWAGARYWLTIASSDDERMKLAEAEAARLGGYLKSYPASAASMGIQLDESISALQRNLKRVYDPAGIMNSGALLG
jgi:glycolate dehydrogenase FAD-binding subunit